MRDLWGSQGLSSIGVVTQKSQGCLCFCVSHPSILWSLFHSQQTPGASVNYCYHVACIKAAHPAHSPHRWAESCQITETRQTTRHKDPVLMQSAVNLTDFVPDWDKIENKTQPRGLKFEVGPMVSELDPCWAFWCSSLHICHPLIDL